MTTISSAPPFDMEFLQTEDTMELASSPHMPQDDFDLDLDTIQEPRLAHEDSMVEDAPDDQQAEHLDDDQMVDEDTAGHQFPDNVSDLNMEAHHEDGSTLEDEDILYEDDEAPNEIEHAQSVNESTVIEPEHNNPQQPFGAVSDNVDVDSHIEDGLTFTEDAENAALTSEPHVTEFTEDLHELQEPIEAQDFYEATDEEIAEAQADDQAHPDVAVEPGRDLQISNTNTNSTDAAEAALPQTVDQDTTEHSNFVGEEAAGEKHAYPHETPEVTLHTVKVIYQDSEICLFPPQTEEGTETFFLSDHGLAHETLDKLLSSCRAVLADTIGDDDELVLDVASLGLHISEGSKYATEITMSQILDVYLTLSHNDNIEQIEPLYCHLSSRVCLASQYAYLATAAQQGKTITEIIAEHMDSPDIEGYEDEQEHLEDPIGDSSAHYEAPNSALPSPEQTGFENAEQHDAGTGTETNESGEAQANNDSIGTGITHETEATDGESSRGIAGIDQHVEIETVDVSAALVGNGGLEDDGIAPDDTEYQEDIDEVAHDDPDETVQEPVPPEEEQLDASSANDETASSGTVEAEVRNHQEQYFEDSAEHNDHHLESLANGGEQTDDISAEPEAQDEQTFPSPEDASHNVDPLQLGDGDEDDMLDLGPEDQEQLSTDEPESAANWDKTDFQDLEDKGDLIAEADASTDQTLDNTQGDDGEIDELDDFVLPATPARTRSAKRKAEADDEDEFDLLDIETPDKKRRRPS